MNNLAEQQNEKVDPQESPASRSKKIIPNWRKYINRLIADEISYFAKYFNRTIQVQPRDSDTGLLLDYITCPRKTTTHTISELPTKSALASEPVLLLLNGNLNHDLDIEGSLSNLKPKLSRSSRIVAVIYNPYFSWIYKLANHLKLREGEIPSSFITQRDLKNIATLAGYEVVKLRSVVACPWRLLGLGTLINKIFPALPILRWLCLTAVVVLRPIIPDIKNPSLSIIIPARNEKGNIENALKRLDYMKDLDLEIIFIEGHSKDQTWEEIKRVAEIYSNRFKISYYQQSGKGKSDAVRLGFSKATKDLVTILDADLTMPPELLERFYQAYVSGKGDFINGNRLTYPMEGQAMRFLNHLGNIFFARALSWLLDCQVGDSLCGTRLMSREDYSRMTIWRNDFGDFDPFGDFEIIFPAAILSLGIVDIPVRYRDRTYGTTNIHRFAHGLLLLRMVMVGLVKVKFRWGSRSVQ